MVHALGAQSLRAVLAVPKPRPLALGLAFVMWGSEQLLPPGAWVTLMDNLIITVFVVDTALIIIERLWRKDHNLP